MNWETAKSWLIVAFLILDVTLGWQVYGSRKALQSYSESYPDQLANTKTLLAEHGFDLIANVPTQHPDMPLLHADLSTPSLSNLTQVAFPGVKDANIDTGAGQVQTSVGQIRLVDTGTWQTTYTNGPKLTSKDSTTVLQYVWHGDEYVLDSGQSAVTDTQPAVGSLPNEFVMQYNSFPVFDASVTATISGQQLKDYTQVFITNMTANPDAKQTITALDALNNLANTVDKSMQGKDNRILSIQLGFYHKFSDSAAGEAATSTSDLWFPVWRVVTDNQTYFVNALTGEVDTE